MIDYKYSGLFQKNSVDKQFRIEFDGGVITNTELHLENFELNESICSDNELRFGSCEASSIKFKISNIFTPLKNKWLTVSITLDENTDNPFILGNYKVYSDVPTADKRYREVTAYDIMYDILNTDVSTWYESLKFPMTLKNFRNSFLSYFGIEQEEVNLPQDEMTVEKTVSPSSMSGKDVILSICEINGCFGKIGRDGKFKYVFLQQDIHGLYPDNDLYPDNTLFPRNSSSIKVPNNIYITCTYEDFVTQRIDKLQIRQSENDVGSIVGTGNNCYIVQNNFLVYGKNTDELKEIAEKLFEEIKNISYRPFDATKLGNPCLETGDAIRIVTKYELVESYIFKRTIKGIQSLRESISSSGVYEYSEKVNSVNSSIIQLKGKTNELERNVEETKSTITDVEKGLQSQITQNAEMISTEVTRAKGAEGSLSTRITQTADSITSEVERATKAEGSLSTRITQTATEVSSKVSKNNVVSEINQSAEQVKIKANKISLEGLVTVNEAFRIDELGGLHATEADISGYITANSFRCYDSIIMSYSNYPAEAKVLEIGVDMTTGSLWATIDPGHVTEYVDVNTKITSNYIAQLPGIISNESNLTLENGSVLIGIYGTSFRPQSAYKDLTTLGTANLYWNAIYSKNGTISTSDRNAKENIEYMDDKETFFNSLKPCTFKFKNGDRTHFGFISQDVEEALKENGMTAFDFAGFCKDLKMETFINDDGEEEERIVLDEIGEEQYIYSLRYSEFIALNTHMIQKANKKIEQQQKEIDDLKCTVSFLMEKLERLGV